MKTLH